MMHIEIKMCYFQAAGIDVVSVLNLVVCDDLLRVRNASQPYWNE